MRPIVAITLILVGAFLIALPPLSDHLHESNIVRLLERPGTTNVRVGVESMSEMYRFGCWATGALVMGISIWASTSRRPESKEIP